MKANQILLVIDIQREYVTEGRPFYIESIAPSLERARLVLYKARQEGWDILHVRHLQEGNLFNKHSEFGDYVEGFEPLPGEQEFIKSNFSCFSNPDFTKYLEGKNELPIYVIGYGSTMCCLSTIVDGYHRGYEFIFIEDASRAKKTKHYGEAVNHSFAAEHIATFAKVQTSLDLQPNPILFR